MDGMSWIGSLLETTGEWLEVAVIAGVYAGLMAVVVLVINLLFRRWLSAGQMGLLWALVVLRLVVPIVPGSALSLENLVKFDDNQAVIALDVNGPTMLEAAVAKGAAPDNVRQLTELKLPTAAPETTGVMYLLDAVLVAIPLAWLACGMGGFVYTVVNYARFCRRVNRVAACDDSRLLRLWAQCCKTAGVKRAGRVLQFDGVEQPAIMGAWRPTLLLPANAVELDDQQLRMVMLHELAHVRRGDIAANWALVAIRAIHWWNPVYWLAVMRFRSLREQACDAFVVRSLEGDSTHGYGELLLSLSQHRSSSAAWRVMLPASILSFFPSLFRQRAVRVRLKALRGAKAKRGWLQVASVAALLITLAVSGFTVAREEIEKPMDLPTWMASHPDAVLAPKRSYVVPEVYDGPRETREYDIAACLDRIGEKGASADEARRTLWFTLRLLYDRGHSGRDMSVGTNRAYRDPADPHGAAITYVDSSPLSFQINCTTLSATGPAGLHDKLRKTLEAWSEGGLGQITVETRFISSNRDLVSDLGVSWQFLEAFSSERESAFPAAGRDGAHVVRAEARVDEYLPLVVSKLNEAQAAKLIDIAQNERRSNVLNAPKVTIFNGQEAMIADCVQRPFVVGMFQRAAGAAEPKVVVLEEGTKIKVRAVQGHDGKKIHIEASLDMKALGEVTTASTSYRGAPVTIQVPSVNRRSIDVAGDIEDGQTLLVGCIPTGKQKQYLYFLLSVRRITEAAPAATGTVPRGK